MTNITINGKELSIAFNLATELTYEEITGKAFDISNFITAEGKAQTRELVNAAIACVIANNPDTEIDADYILYRATREESVTMVTSAIEEFMKWVHIPSIADAHVPEPTAEEAAKKKD